MKKIEDTLNHYIKEVMEKEENPIPMINGAVEIVSRIKKDLQKGFKKSSKKFEMTVYHKNEKGFIETEDQKICFSNEPLRSVDDHKLFKEDGKLVGMAILWNYDKEREEGNATEIIIDDYIIKIGETRKVKIRGGLDSWKK